MESILSRATKWKDFPGLTLRHNIIHKKNTEQSGIHQAMTVTKTEPKQWGNSMLETMEAEIQLSLALNHLNSYFMHTHT